MNAAAPITFASLVERFFLDRLMTQLHASPQTVAAYRDTFRLVLAFAHRTLGKRPADLALADLDAPFVLAFLKHLEEERHNTIRSRNARLAAVRSFMHFVAFQDPGAVGLVQRVLAIPMKRFERPLIGYLTRPQIEAVLLAPDETTWIGRRDRMMLTVLYNSGTRVSELIGLRRGDLVLDPTASVKVLGKGRKERAVPLWPQTRARLRQWLREIPPDPHAPLFPNRNGRPMSRVSVAERLALAVDVASQQYPQLARQKVSPHVLRHSLAMHLLQSGVDLTVIALWLGHESPVTTHQYVEADLAMKTRALESLHAPSSRPLHYRPTDHMLEFLKSL
ncbi:MAG: tyrosine-type recombinase/integrase [Burkholderiales bacterium]|nr:tyrosine-type recombinase/integrase [Burkholderiales bacterium]